MKQLLQKNKNNLLIGAAIVVAFVLLSQFMMGGQQMIIEERNLQFGLDYLKPTPDVDVYLRSSGDETHFINISINILSYSETPIDYISVWFDDTMLRELDSEAITHDAPFVLDFAVAVTATIPAESTVNDVWYEPHTIKTFIRSTTEPESFVQYEFRAKYTWWEGYTGPAPVVVVGDTTTPQTPTVSDGIPMETVAIGIVAVVVIGGLFFLNTRKKVKK